MTFQIASITHVIDDVTKIIELFVHYNGQTHSVQINHDSFNTPESTKATIIQAIATSIDTIAAVSGNPIVQNIASISNAVMENK